MANGDQPVDNRNQPESSGAAKDGDQSRPEASSPGQPQPTAANADQEADGQEPKTGAGAKQDDGGANLNAQD